MEHNIESQIQTEENTVKMLDNQIESNDDLQKYAQELFSTYQRLELLKQKIDLVQDKENEAKLLSKLNTVYTMVYDLYDNATIDNSVEKSLGAATTQFNEFVNAYSQTARNKIGIQLGGMLVLAEQAPVEKTQIAGHFRRGGSIAYYQGEECTIVHKDFGINESFYYIKTTTGELKIVSSDQLTYTSYSYFPDYVSYEPEFIYGNKVVKKIETINDDILIKFKTANGDIDTRRITDITYIYNEDGSISAGYMDQPVHIIGIIDCIITFQDGTTQGGNLSEVKRIENTSSEYIDRIYGGSEVFNQKILGDQIIAIIGNPNLNYSDKYSSLLQTGSTMDNNQKIEFAAIVSRYFGAIYDTGLYKYKKNILKGLFKDKSSSTEDLYTKKIAGACADHHIAVAQLLVGFTIPAGVVSITSGGLHAITRAKNDDQYVLIDYGQIYTSTSSEDLLAKYYALHKKTPKPFDIVTGPDGKIIGTISTPLGRLIEANLSPFGEGESANVAKDRSTHRGQFFQQGTTTEGYANNQQQQINIDHAISPDKRFGVDLQHISWIDDAQVNHAGIDYTQLGASGKTAYTIKGVMHNTIWNTNEHPLERPGIVTSPNNKEINSALAVGISFGHKYRFSDRQIGNTTLHPATATQIGLQFDNLTSPGFVANSALAVTSDPINIGPTDISFQASIQGDYLPNRIDTPVNTMHIKPTITGGATVLHTVGSSTLQASGEIGVTRYNAGAHNIHYGGQVSFKNQRVSLSAGIEGNKQQNTTSILTNQILLETQVQYRPNILGDKMTVFGGYNTTMINGIQTSQLFTVGAKYDIQ